jgi:hypothetical protein
MPVLALFHGRPVKRRRRVATGIRLTFFDPRPGAPGEQMIVSEADWHRFASVQFLPRCQMPDVRALAAMVQSNPKP